MSPNYSHTNESLDAIVKGMNVNETDDIIAVCGSGDQAFALLEYAGSVLAVDSDRQQIEYAQKGQKRSRQGIMMAFFHALMIYILIRMGVMERFCWK